MFNKDKFNEILQVYKRDFISKQWENEKYKWVAVKHFQNNWDIHADNFGKMFMTATEKTYNLLTSMNSFPRGMIKEFALNDAEATKDMFKYLFDESIDLGERIEAFMSAAEVIRDKYDPGTWKQHYQNLNSISTYLWLKYPDKYYIYKYSVAKEVSSVLNYDFQPKKGRSTNNIINIYKLYDAISTELQHDPELVQSFKSLTTNDCHSDVNLNTLAIDFAYYISTSFKKPSSDEWLPNDYTPGFTVAEWRALLSDKSIFNTDAMTVMKRLLDIGGNATCKQLAMKYGKSNNYYNSTSTALAKRVHQKTNCPLLLEDNENSRWWPVLYLGRHSNKKEDGVYIWKLRDELKEALTEIDLSDILLYEETIIVESDTNYWWLNASPKIWSFSNLAVGDEQNYTLYNENGNKRRIFQNFLDSKPGDMIIGYESNPVKKVVSLAKITQENNGENLYFEKVESFPNPVDYITLKSCPELASMEYFVNSQGSLFKLTKEEYDFILDIVRESNPVQVINSNPLYTKEDFLSEVYMSQERYDTLISLLKNKKNVILQGAPGVGKTFAAKRLAFSMMGEKDESRVTFIQFHQNYSYEDFIMGYKPVEDGFELQTGIFYKFCQKASNTPDKPFFFIIDEINRGNLSKIFGELLMLIENGYRKEKAILAYSGLPFSVPENVYIIGMMNTADRSLAMIDYALRRRFSFFEMEPGYHSDGFRTYQNKLNNEDFNDLIEVVKSLNKAIETDNALGKGFCIGHSYFCNQIAYSEEWLFQVIYHDLLPLLNEYWFDEPSKIKQWEENLQGVLND